MPSMPFGSLWLPVVVSAVAVFVVSSVLHMALRYHRADYKKLPDEDAVAGVLRPMNLSPGVYVMPYSSDMAQMKDPAFQKKFTDGPVALLNVRASGPPAMGKYLLQWFLFSVLVSFITGYIARHTLHPDTAGLEVMRITGSVAFVAYGLGAIQDSIWQAIPWPNTFRALIDAGIFALTTGLVFRLLWPHA